MTDQVCVTFASVTTICQGLTTQVDLPWLGDEERQRLCAFTSPKRRREFVAGRWLARQCLADAFGGKAADFELSAPERGRPEVVTGHRDNRRAVFFSLSHSADRLACAVAELPVGVDIEDLARARDVAGLAELVCAPSELHQLGGLVGAPLKLAFHARWGLKEAWIKRFGLTSPNMRALPFEPCEPGQQGDAVVLLGDEFLAAVTPAIALDVRCTGDQPLTLIKASDWRVSAA